MASAPNKRYLWLADPIGIYGTFKSYLDEYEEDELPREPRENERRLCRPRDRLLDAERLLNGDFFALKKIKQFEYNTHRLNEILYSRFGCRNISEYDHFRLIFISSLYFISDSYRSRISIG